MKTRDRYSSAQLALHWLVVLLVAVQFIVNDSMSRAFEAGVDTGALPPDEGGVVPHAVGGLAILAAMSLRLWLRLTHGVPAAPTSEPGWMQWVSRANHWAFYAVLLAMPVVGLLALLTLAPALGELHETLAAVLVGLIVLHVAGALLHWVRPGSQAHRRMVRAYSDSPPAD